MAKHAKRLARAKKAGFSLVELIIVIAIMVALVAVMAPAYVKYVQRSHDAVVEAAAESVLQYVKTEMGAGYFTGAGVIVVEGRQDPGEAHRTIHIDWQDGNTFEYNPTGTLADDKGEAQFFEACGADATKTIKSNLKYIITVRDSMTVQGHPQLEMESTTNSGD